MSSVDVAELWGQVKHAGKKLRTYRVSYCKGELNGKIPFLRENRDRRTHVFNFSEPWGKLTSGKANSKTKTPWHVKENEKECRRTLL